MTNNDILRRIRYMFDYSNPRIIEILNLSGRKVSQEEVIGWLAKEESDAYLECGDKDLAYFLNGFITLHRGARENDPQIAEPRLTNNLIIAKLKIALTLRSEDIITILAESGFTISKSELTALFRKKGHKHYRECGDQILRNLLNGLQKRYRP